MISIVLKLTRASHRLKELHDSFLTFAASKPYEFRIEPETDSDRHVLVARPRIPWPTQEWGVVIGEYAHNVRSALNLLVYQASTLPLKDKKRRKLQFPIIDEQREFDREESQQLHGVPDDMRAVIKWSQPFASRNERVGEALRMLREMNNADKHRLVPVVVATAKLESLRSDSGIFRGLEISGDAHIQLERHGFLSSFEGVGDGTILGNRSVIAMLRLDPRFDAQFEPKVTAIVKFEDGFLGSEIVYVMPTLSGILDCVRLLFTKIGTCARHVA